MLREGAVKDLPQGYEVDKHFNPRYRPWDQRLCLVPDSDLLKSISEGRASVVTDEIETFTERGVRLKSGEELEADIIVSATGLQMLALGAVQLDVDGDAARSSDALHLQGNDAEQRARTSPSASATPTPRGLCARTWLRPLSAAC